MAELAAVDEIDFAAEAVEQQAVVENVRVAGKISAVEQTVVEEQIAVEI